MEKDSVRILRRVSSSWPARRSSSRYRPQRPASRWSRAPPSLTPTGPSARPRACGRTSPKRPPGSEEQTDVINWITSQLPNPEMAAVDSFEAPMGNETVTLQNVAVVLPGTSRGDHPHRRSRATRPPWSRSSRSPIPAAPAMLLELIQVFSARPHTKTLIFLSTEDASNGGLGISHFLGHRATSAGTCRPSSPSTVWARNSSPASARALSAGVTAAQGTTPGWLVQLARHVLDEAGLKLDVPGLLSQAADHALSLSKGDQVAGLSRGIASLRLYDDGQGNPSADGLATQGAALEQADPLAGHGHRGPARSGHGSAAPVRALPHQQGHHHTRDPLPVSRARRSGHLAVWPPASTRGPPCAICATSPRSPCPWRSSSSGATSWPSPGSSPGTGSRCPPWTDPARSPGCSHASSSSFWGGRFRRVAPLPGLLPPAGIQGGHRDGQAVHRLPQPPAGHDPDALAVPLPDTPLPGRGLDLAPRHLLRRARLFGGALATPADHQRPTAPVRPAGASRSCTATWPWATRWAGGGPGGT